VKIIAVNPSPYNQNGIENVVALLSGSEIEMLMGWPYRDAVRKVGPGSEILLSDRILHALEIEKSANEATKLPEQLRTLASMLEMHNPAIKASVAAEPPSDPK
jgi:hypothetical protein